MADHLSGRLAGGILRHNDPKLPPFFDRFRAAKSEDVRRQTYRELEKYVLQEQWYAIPLFDEQLTIPYRSYVQGLFAPPEEISHNLDYASVWLNK